MILPMLLMGLLMALAIYIVVAMRLGVSGATSIICGVGAVFLYSVWAGWL